MKRYFGDPDSCQRLFLLTAVIVGLCTLQGCASTPVDQRLYAVDVALTQSMQLATDLRHDGFISDADWPKVKGGLKDASSRLDQAWALYKADPEGAGKEILSVEALVGELKRWLIERQQQRMEAPSVSLVPLPPAQPPPPGVRSPVPQGNPPITRPIKLR